MKELAVNDVNAREYYIINDTSSGESLYIHKEKSAPAFFRGCFDYCYSCELATIYKDMNCQWTLLSILTDDIANAFLDWASLNFELLNSPLLSTESSWAKSEEDYQKQGFKLVALRGRLDMYCMLRYLTVCCKEEACWNDIYKKIELEYCKDFV